MEKQAWPCNVSHSSSQREENRKREKSKTKYQANLEGTSHKISLVLCLGAGQRIWQFFCLVWARSVLGGDNRDKRTYHKILILRRQHLPALSSSELRLQSSRFQKKIIIIAIIPLIERRLIVIIRGGRRESEAAK